MLICLLLITGGPSAVQAEWRKQESGTLAWLRAIEFLTAEKGFVAGSNGTLLATEDAGRTWRRMTVPTSDTIRDLRFQDAANGWMLCDRGRTLAGRDPSYLMRTLDGGRSWSVIEIAGEASRFDRMFFAPDGSGFLAGEGGKLAGFDRNGEARGSLPLSIRYLITGGTVVGGSRLVLVGGGGTIVFSDDSGRTWQASVFQGDKPTLKINSIAFIDARFGWTAGNQGLIFSTSDGGRSWRPQSSGIGSDIYDIAFRDQMAGFAVGDAGSVLATIDGGKTWSLDRSGAKHRLERVVFAGERAFAVGFGGTIVSTSLRERQ